MAVSSTPPSHFSDDVIWHSLKQAIAASSGFQRWRAERETLDGQLESQAEVPSEQLVSRYLRETLETLAY
jgi:hypothetical protein